MNRQGEAASVSEFITDPSLKWLNTKNVKRIMLEIKNTKNTAHTFYLNVHRCRFFVLKNFGNPGFKILWNHKTWLHIIKVKSSASSNLLVYTTVRLIGKVSFVCKCKGYDLLFVVLFWTDGTRVKQAEDTWLLDFKDNSNYL